MDTAITEKSRNRLRMDAGWRFAFGHPHDAEKDFRHGTGYFSHITKTGYGDGPANPHFDDRAWRLLDLPHDWAVEAGFDSHAGHSHGYKAVGRNYPESSVGWYRKKIFIPREDLNRRISLEFDGIHRDSQIWINGFYLGLERSGYDGFAFDVTDYLNYGADNTVAVRADATLEEGWYYEGAGIYRHVWLVKTAPLHILRHGIFVTTVTKGRTTLVTVRTKVRNDTNETARFLLEHLITPSGIRKRSPSLCLSPGEEREITAVLRLKDAPLWSIESPFLHELTTTLLDDKVAVDELNTPFGIRSLRFDPDLGFFLNGIPLKIKGTNNHQDHAVVGTAVPDGLQEFRIRTLKEMGCNAYRSSHNPPTPELLDACDRLGMLVVPENRLMGVTPDILKQLERMILRDRNHPCVIAWSIGNEEWAIEGNEKGARIAATLQKETLRLDPSRRVTAGISGGWGHGISTVIDVMGFNYISHGNTDEHHAKFPLQPSLGTEESTTSCTRGVYEDDRENGHMAPPDRTEEGRKGEWIGKGWAWFAERPYLAGCFFWTGFDYRGEPNPLKWPAVLSQFGLLDTCGFPKDTALYLRTWWRPEPFLHISPHWTWPGREGRAIPVRIYANTEEVELSLNGRSLGRKTMERYGHLDWSVPFEPGTLSAAGFTGDNQTVSDRHDTAGPPTRLCLQPDQTLLETGTDAVSVITISAEDHDGHPCPTADLPVFFSLSGPGRLIGAGNGDPASHEPDRFFDEVLSLPLLDWKWKPLSQNDTPAAIETGSDESDWKSFFIREEEKADLLPDTPVAYKEFFELPSVPEESVVLLFLCGFGETHDIYLNGKLLWEGLTEEEIMTKEFLPDRTRLVTGQNTIAIIAPPFREKQKRFQFARANNLGCVRVQTPAQPWQRRLFNGLAQVILQSGNEPGEILLTASSPGITPAQVRIEVKMSPPRPSVP